MALASRISTWKLATLAFFLLVALPIGVSSAIEEAGSLDTSFGGDGRVFTPFLPQDAGAFAIALQPDGKLVVVGGVEPDFAFALARYNTNGTVDQTFGIGGKVITDVPDIVGGAYAVAIQADGKIIVGGAGALARYNTDGTLDTTFGGGDGVVSVGVSDIAIQADGKIVVRGGGLARYNSDGTLDTTFGGGDGVVQTGAMDMALQSDGKIVVVPDEATVTRYNPDGTLDTSFGDGGSVHPAPFPGDYNWINVVAIQSDGTILAGGATEACGGGPGGCGHYFELFRFAADGAHKSTFGGSWRVMEEVRDIAVQANGQIIVTGPSGEDRFALVRFKTNGDFDRTFSGDGYRFIRFKQNSGYLSAIALQANGRIVVVGGAEGALHSKFALARYLA